MNASVSLPPFSSCTSSPNSTEGRSFQIISLFAGAGGMDLGFEKAGFTTIWANDHDKNMIPSYRSFFPRAILDTRSIREIHGSEIPKADGVIGGPPCQSWSTAGARRGVHDPRGQLFYDYIRVIHHVKPLFFVAENVSGLIQGKNREFFRQILRVMEEEGYKVTWKLVNAHHYGVPQDRLRVSILNALFFLLPCRSDPHSEMPFLTYATLKSANPVR